jgi:hypothetical protein
LITQHGTDITAMRTDVKQNGDTITYINGEIKKQLTVNG